MTIDANGKLARCPVTRFVPGGANEQCLNGPHDLAKKPAGCRFASEAIEERTHAACVAEMNRLQGERDEWKRAHDSACGVIQAIEGSRDRMRAELATLQADRDELVERVARLLADKAVRR